MSLDLNQSNVSLDNPTFSPMLEKLQANILKGHGRNFAHHLFFQFDRTKIDLAKKWISQFASTKITSAHKQLVATHDRHLGYIADGGTVYTLSLSSAGYDVLGLTASKPHSPAFEHGLEGSAHLLGDHKATWEEPFKNHIHMLIIVADDIGLTAKVKAGYIVEQTAPFAKLLLDQKGNVLKMTSGIGIEHFGYADGISQPLYLKDDINKQPTTHEWNDATNLNLLLVPDRGTHEPDSFGSYFVFRKLEQNVKGFKDAEGDGNDSDRILPKIKDVTGNNNDDLRGAMIVGRYESSSPVIKSSIDTMPNPPVVTNDFDYRNDLGLKCPYHAHIRLMNPRNGDPLAHGNDITAHRITRRGIPYDDESTKRIPEDKITKITDEMLEDKLPKGKVGLLFMCYQAEIANQFEVLQAFWANQGLIGFPPVKGQDSIITQGTDLPRTLPQQWGQPLQSEPFKFSGFVTMKGGEYFFTPSISFLKGLA